MYHRDDEYTPELTPEQAHWIHLAAQAQAGSQRAAAEMTLWLPQLSRPKPGTVPLFRNLAIINAESETDQ